MQHPAAIWPSTVWRPKLLRGKKLGKISEPRKHELDRIGDAIHFGFSTECFCGFVPKGGVLSIAFSKAASWLRLALLARRSRATNLVHASSEKNGVLLCGHVYRHGQDG